MLQKMFVADLDPDRLAQRQGEADSAAQEGPPAEPAAASGAAASPADQRRGENAVGQ